MRTEHWTTSATELSGIGEPVFLSLGAHGAYGVFDEDGVHLRDDLELRSPATDEVVVRLLAAGVCHSDVKVFTRVTRLPLPLVMGHEGAGIVESVGSAVDSVAPGDFVVIHTLRSCGWCR